MTSHKGQICGNRIRGIQWVLISIKLKTQAKYRNVTFRRVRVTIIAVEKQ